MLPLRFGVSYDFRNPPDSGISDWVPVASAMAALTERIRFNTDICLMPFNHPIRLAEDLAVLDNISNGRVEIGLGMG